MPGIKESLRRGYPGASHPAAGSSVILLAASQSVRSRLLRNQQAGQCALKRAGGLGGAQSLDGVDEGTALGYDAVNESLSHGSELAAGRATDLPTIT